MLHARLLEQALELKISRRAGAYAESSSRSRRIEYHGKARYDSAWLDFARRQWPRYCTVVADASL